MKKIWNSLKKSVKNFLFRLKLKRMDAQWHFYGGSSYDVIPPSYYYTHTPEEIEQIRSREIEDLKKMLDEYDAKYLNRKSE